MKFHSYIAATAKNTQKLLALDVEGSTLLSLWLSDSEKPNGAIYLVSAQSKNNFLRTVKKAGIKVAEEKNERRAITMLKEMTGFR